MADKASRNSLFLAAVPSLLLVWAMAFMVAVYGWRIERDPGQAAPAPSTVTAVPMPTTKSPAPPLALAQQADNASPSGTMCGPGGALPLNEDANVDIVNCWRPIRLSYGDIRISVRLRPYRDGQVSESVVTFRRPGLPRQRIVVSAAEIGGLTFRVGRLDRTGTPYIMVRSFTAGEHCCIGVHVVIPEGPDRGAVELGYFDVNDFEREETRPTDLDGDGRIDFVARDDRFYYEFASYLFTTAPPLKIWNIRRGRAVDVSAEPRFRPAYLRELAWRRGDCLQEDHRAVVLSCPAYVATAARVGRFRSAWRDMLGVYDPEQHDQTIDEHFPHHLRRFLRANQYLPT